MGRLVACTTWMLLFWVAPAVAGIPAEGSKAPAVSLRDLSAEGKTVTSSQLFRDRVTLLSFFATWCESCKKEIPVLKRLDAQYRNRGFQVVLVCLDIMGARNVGPYLEEAGGVGLRVMIDKVGEISNRYGVVRLPTTLLVGPDEAVISAWELVHPEKLEQVEAYAARLPARAESALSPKARSGGKP